ncbi:MAG: prolyl-tRNA synthetase associated domain-containing protein [Prevotellaceae bacterium]|jgi:Ala-tRNA(Pro) deacylase|nr:prolyl-tRNA synthetase associated domain-containing protein [Prevotellaceae bacterium]
MNGYPKLYELLKRLNIEFDYYEHPPVPTVEEAKKYWADVDATHCKNLFFRNHKGDKHYLVVLEHTRHMDIRSIEQMLRQGKLSFASPERLMKYLGVQPGSVTPLALINDTENHVKLFLDKNLENSERISFHPCINTASLVVKYSDFIRFIDSVGNEYEFIQVY